MRRIACALVVLLPISATAQEHDHSKMVMTPATGWQFMQDGVIHVEYNDQGSPRGGEEFVAPNWWMLMAQRKTVSRHARPLRDVEPRRRHGR